MSEKWKLEQSRENWKKKAIQRGNENRALRKECNRIKDEREHYKQKNKTVEQQLKIQQEQKTTVCKIEIIFITISLFLTARIGFRAISRVLAVLGSKLGLSKTPCAQTVSNWITRLSIVKMQATLQNMQNKTFTNINNGFVWLIDISIGLGAGKILSVLSLDLNHHKDHNRAPKLLDVTCVAVSVATSWTGEKIAAFLETVIDNVKGAPCAFLKDGGADLEKAVGILNNQGKLCLCIADISHIMANLFKNTYAKNPVFDTFISACGQVSKNLQQTLLASLAPPKISNRARFMNLHQLVSWADKLLKQSLPGKASEGSMLAKLRGKLDLLPTCKTFIKQFLRDAVPVLECQKILKSEGLSIDSYRKCERIINTLNLSKSISNGFAQWAEEHLAISSQLNLGQTALPISTDSIESLFGVGKRLGSGQIKDADRIALRLPTFCGDFSKEDAQKVSQISLEQQKKLTNKRNSLIKQRRDILSNPGRLETLSKTLESENFQIIMSLPEIKSSIESDLQVNTS